MSHKLCFVSIIAVVIFASGISSAESNLTKELQMMKSSEKHGDFIDSFAKMARDKKYKDVFAALDPDSIKGVSNEQLREAMNQVVFPFFAKYEKMNNYEQITNAQLQDGRTGLWHYTYIVDTDGDNQPFHIAIIDTKSGLKVLSVQVGQCVKGRHPAIPPCD